MGVSRGIPKLGTRGEEGEVYLHTLRDKDTGL